MSRLMNRRLIQAVQSVLLIALPPVGQVALAEGQTAVLEEIVVTARKREERLIDVPMAVSSFSGEQLEATGVESIKELYGTAPNVYFVAAEFGSDTIGQHLVVRGIGATPIIEPGVGTFVDGVYQPNMGFDMDFLEVERVEILRGPQGTLFGRNTQGGALNIVTRKPGDAFEGKARLRADEFDTVDLQGYVAGPVGERLAMSLAVRYEESDGFLDNIELDRPQTAFDQLVSQARVVANPTDTLTLDLSVDVKRWRGGMLGAGVPDSGIDDYLTYNSRPGRQQGRHRRSIVPARLGPPLGDVHLDHGQSRSRDPAVLRYRRPGVRGQLPAHPGRTGDPVPGVPPRLERGGQPLGLDARRLLVRRGSATWTRTSSRARRIRPSASWPG